MTATADLAPATRPRKVLPTCTAWCTIDHAADDDPGYPPIHVGDTTVVPLPGKGWEASVQLVLYEADGPADVPEPEVEVHILMLEGPFRDIHPIGGLSIAAASKLADLIYAKVNQAKAT
jgi:hypothetical protein